MAHVGTVTLLYLAVVIRCKVATNFDHDYDYEFMIVFLKF